MSLPDELPAFPASGCHSKQVLYRRMRIRSAVIVAVQGNKPMTASIATDLPEPDSPTIDRISRWHQRSGKLRRPPVDWHGTHRRRWRSSTVRLLNIQKRPSAQLRFSLGSSASRKPSPIRLMASTVVTRIINPGKGHNPPGARRMNSRASASIVPHSGVGGCAPMPRKPSAAASRMALENDSARLNDQRRHAIGQDGLEHQPQGP